MAVLTETLTIENVVASTGVGQELDLESLAMDMGELTTILTTSRD